MNCMLILWHANSIPAYSAEPSFNKEFSRDFDAESVISNSQCSVSIGVVHITSNSTKVAKLSRKTKLFSNSSRNYGIIYYMIFKFKNNLLKGK